MTTSQAQSHAKKKAKESEPETDGKANGEAGNMFAPNAGTTSLLRGGAAAMEHWVASSQELARFYSTRLKQDVSPMSALASCRSPKDFTEVWFNAASNAVHDYANEFDRILAISLKK